jgi:hypothetical protein
MNDAKSTEFKIKSKSNFITFLKRFANIEKGLLLEVHQDCIKAKQHTEDKSVVKYSRMPMADVLEGTMSMDLIKVGIHDIKKIINVFGHFSDADEIFLKIEHENIGDEYIATNMVFKSSSLKIKIITVDTSMMIFISPEMMKRMIDSVSAEKIAEFPFPKEAFSKVNSLCSIDSAKDFLNIKVSDGSISMSGKSFEYTVGDATAGVVADFTLYNENFALIEPEISSFVLGSARMIVKSQESDTLIVIGRVE